MTNNKKAGLLETSVTTVRVVLCVMFAFVAFILVYYGVINRAHVIDDEPVEYIESWTVSDGNGEDIEIGRSYAAQKDYENGVSASSTLPDDIKDNEYLFFVTRKDAAVYINGELREDYVEKRDVNIPGGSVKRFYMMVPLKESDRGATVTVVRSSTIKRDQVVSETFISTRFGAFKYLIGTGGLSLFLASIIFIFSIVVFIVSIVLRFWYKLKIDMMYGALGICIIAAWIITDSYLLPLLTGVYHVNGVLNYIFCLMMPCAPAVYLNSVQCGRYKKSMSAIMIASSINVVVWTVLHFTGVLPFYNIRMIENVILAGISITALSVLILDIIRRNIGEYRYTFIGFFVFLVCCLIELVILIVTSGNESLPMVIGLGFLLAFVVIQQVDELRRVNIEKQRMIDISESKTRFLASMSHEIRTPINAILGMNEMILRENKDKTVQEYSRSIKSSGRMLLMLVNDVLDFSKIEAGKLEIVKTHFYMSEMLYDVISLVKERADEKSLELNAQIGGDIPNEIISDEFRIRQILVNLINNAVKYTEKGTVTLILGGRFTDGGYELCLTVKDTGKGIRKQDQATLFEAFTRADVKSNVNIEGTGLGLAIVKSIVNSMNGNLGVESEYGVGSEFWVRLPVEYADKTPIPSDFMQHRVDYDATDDTCDFTAPDASVLAVDDNQSNLAIVQLFLKRTGIVPDLCSTGTGAVEHCKHKKYDLILLDHMMPQPDGVETLHIIRTDENSLNKDTKAVVLTANAVAGSRKMYLDEGFDDYLTKPIDAAVLEQTVKTLLPPEKVLKADRRTDTAQNDDMSPTKRKLSAIKGLDYEKALGYCAGDEAFLAQLADSIASDCSEHAEKMRKSLAADDIRTYGIEAHTIKSTMATIGIEHLRARAQRHEFAAKDNDKEFIAADAEGFINEYLEICGKLKG